MPNKQPPNPQIEWIKELLKRAMLARSCQLKEEALALCNIAENRYRALLKHPSIEVRMLAAYSNAAALISNVRMMIGDDSFWLPSNSDLNFSRLLFEDNDQNINTENL